MQKHRKPSRKQLQQSLQQALFDPRAPGAAQVLVEMDSPQYLEMRVREELAQMAALLPADTKIPGIHRKILDRCIGLLALSKILRDPSIGSETTLKRKLAVCPAAFHGEGEIGCICAELAKAKRDKEAKK